MRGFRRRTTVREALDWLDRHLAPLGSESVPLRAAAGRTLAEDVISPVDVPGFDRSMMDGYAVQAASTQGASPYHRQPLRVVGEILPGRPSGVAIAAGEAARIMTGAALPAGADAVLPAEKVELQGSRLYALDEVSPGKHVSRAGEDVAQGTTILRAGRRLRPQDVGLLSAVGMGLVPVIRRPRVRIVVTGDELLPPGSAPQGHRIADANGPMLATLVERDGGVPLERGIVPDDPQVILLALRDEGDVVLVSGGSSVGQEDHTPTVISEHGQLAIHGIAMRPSSPTGMGVLDGRLVILLPGNPVSCLCAYDMFAGRAVRAMGGRSKDWPYPRVQLPLRRKLVSTAGRLDYARVQVTHEGVEPVAISGASVLSSTTRADGFVLIPEDSEGYPAGAVVDVFLYD